MTLEQFKIGVLALQQQFQGPVVAIGLASAGPANLAGQIQISTNYGPLWNYFNVRRMVEECFEVPVSYENDANAAALAEQRELITQYPRFKGLPGLLATVGTGLGAGVINSSGELDRGANGLGGELGHLPMRRPISSIDLAEREIECGCTQIGCAEQYATLSFIERELQHRIQGNSSHPLRGESDPREAAKKVLQLAGKGDPLCLAIITDQARNLGRFLGEQIVDKDPAWVLIGGGITEAVPVVRDAYLTHVRSEIRARVGDLSFNKRYIEYAGLGDNAGWVGATMSAAKMLNELAT